MSMSTNKAKAKKPPVELRRGGIGNCYIPKPKPTKATKSEAPLPAASRYQM